MCLKGLPDDRSPHCKMEQKKLNNYERNNRYEL